MSTRSDFIMLDTSVLVHLLRGKAIGQKIAQDHRLIDRPERPLISVVTVGELKSLALKLRWGHVRQSELDQLVRDLVVITIDRAPILDQYAAIDQFSEQMAKPARRMGKNDLWIAATAVAAGARLFTTDGDFDHLTGKFIEVVKIDSATGATV